MARERGELWAVSAIGQPMSGSRRAGRADRSRELHRAGVALRHARLPRWSATADPRFGRRRGRDRFADLSARRGIRRRVRETARPPRHDTRACTRGCAAGGTRGTTVPPAPASRRAGTWRTTAIPSTSADLDAAAGNGTADDRVARQFADDEQPARGLRISEQQQVVLGDAGRGPQVRRAPSRGCGGCRRRRSPRAARRARRRAPAPRTARSPRPPRRRGTS